MATGETVAEKIADINASKAAIVAAISAKGVTVPEGAKLAELAPLVGQISGGGGGTSDTCTIDRNTMTKLVIPDGTTKIGNYAFYACNALILLTIPDSVTSIGDYAFCNCALTSLTIPDGVTSIRFRTFYRCYKLAWLTISNSVTTIGQSAFFGCPATCNITFAKTMAEVEGMSYYPWGISSGAVIHCTDGDLTVS